MQTASPAQHLELTLQGPPGPCQGDTAGVGVQESAAGALRSWKERELAHCWQLARGCVGAGGDQTDGHGPHSCQPREKASWFSFRGN